MIFRPVAALFFLVLCIGIFATPKHALAAGISLIRDAEIENSIRTYATPVFRAAGLDPDAVNIYIVNDSSLNAFVAGGQNMFINTGLIMRSDNAGQLIGVIAHETGHIAGGHLSRIRDALSASSIPSILSYVLGGAAALATGRGDVGAVIIAGGSGIAQRNFLSYTRGQEAAADHAALKLLDTTKQSARGLEEFMHILEDQELLSTRSQDPYVRSHPLSSDRIRTIEHHVEISPYSDRKPSAEIIEMHARMKAKVSAYINTPGRTLRTYKESDPSLEARYARSVAYHRKADVKNALALINQLINERPQDPYFIEFKAQILYENGRIEEALPFYQKASDLRPDSAVIRKELASAQLGLKRPDLIDPAIKNLRFAISKEPKSSGSWRQLAIAYGMQGDKGRSSLALAEEALLNDNAEVAKYHAGLAERLYKNGTREWLQAQDIQIAVADLERRLKAKKK